MAESDMPPTPTVDDKDLWVLEHQILPNQYGLKYAALRRVVDALQAVQPARRERPDR